MTSVSFTDASSRAARAVQHHLGDGTAAYRHGNGDPVDVRWINERSVEVPDASGQYIERTHVVYLLREELAQEPQVGDRITTAPGDQWVVQRIVSDDGVEIGLAVA